MPHERSGEQGGPGARRRLAYLRRAAEPGRSLAQRAFCLYSKSRKKLLEYLVFIVLFRGGLGEEV